MSSDTPTIDPVLKDQLANQKASLGKRIFWWAVGIGAGLLAIVGVVVYLFKWKSPVQAADETIKKARSEIEKSEIEEKIKLAEAKNAEAAILTRLNQIKDIKDGKQRREELNRMLT